MHLRLLSRTSVSGVRMGAHLGGHMEAIVTMLSSGSLARWNYRQATHKGTWARSRVFFLMGAVGVFLFGFMLPLTISKAMETHPNPTSGTMMAESSQTGSQSSPSAPSSSGIYRDPQGRYSLTVPEGWSAEMQASSGALQLSSGPNWAMLMTGSGGEPRAVNQQFTQQIQSQFTGFQLLNEGDLTVNGHPSHGTNATGVNPKGERVSVLIVTISAGGGRFLTVLSSSPNDQAKTINATIMQMAQSIRFAGE